MVSVIIKKLLDVIVGWPSGTWSGERFERFKWVSSDFDLNVVVNAD